MGVYTEYFQKSKVFLYPLLEYRKGLTHVPKQTYCAWEDVYSIEDRMFLCLYVTPLNDSFKKFIAKNIQANEYFKEHIALENNKHLFVFNFNGLKFDYDNFINGKYSKYSVDSKIKILDFFGTDDKVSEYIQGFLSPESSHEEYAEFLDIDVESLMDVYEICTPPDLEKETLVDNNYLLVRLLKDTSISLKNK
tara:strand:+ start:2953 stop:3531 length:579 start_codon:yes stop_codon:yes gene_type:complete